MAACCGAAITPESSVIDSQIKSDEKVQKTSLKVLVLGTSASGKSTVAKQMKILHCDGFSPEELHNYKQILILNIFNGMKELVFQAEQFGIKILRKNKKVAAYFSNANPYTETLSSDTVEQAKQLWADKGTVLLLKFKASTFEACARPRAAQEAQHRRLQGWHHPSGATFAIFYLRLCAFLSPSSSSSLTNIISFLSHFTLHRRTEDVGTTQRN